MAFMVPLVKNHYDIYARNNPADHNNGHHGPTTGRTHDNSLFLSATSLGKNGAHPVTKQYRIVISGGKVVGGTKAAPKKPNAASGGATKPTLTQAPGGGGKLYYRMPSASISLPVVVSSRGGGLARPPLVPAPKTVPKNNQKSGAIVNQTQTQQEPSSPQSVSPPSRPLPHVRRTVRNPLTNRVYSYSVSIPDYVAEEEEEELEDEEDLDDEEDELDLDMGNDDNEEDKENQDLLLFSTSAPAGTGPIVSVVADSPSPPPVKMCPPGSKKTKKQLSQAQPLSMPSSPEAGGGVIQSGRHPRPARTLSATSTTSTASSATNSREYVELLRKFILHLKMLKIGGGSGKNKSKRSKRNNNNNPTIEDSSAVDNNDNAQPPQLRPRKRKDTMEDSNHL